MNTVPFTNVLVASRNRKRAVHATYYDNKKNLTYCGLWVEDRDSSSIDHAPTCQRCLEEIRSERYTKGHHHLNYEHLEWNKFRSKDGVVKVKGGV
jgi:hypothetical protein